MQRKAFTIFTADGNLPTEDVQLVFVLTLPRHDREKRNHEGHPYAWEVLNFTKGESAAYTVIWQSSRHVAFMDGEKISYEVSKDIELGQYVELKDDLKWMTHTHLYGDTKKFLTINNTSTSKRFVLGSIVSWDDEEVEFQPYTFLRELGKKEALMTQAPSCLQIYKAGLTRHEPIRENLASKQSLLVQGENVPSLEIRLMPDRSWWQLHFDEKGGISLQSVDASDSTTIITIKRIIKKTTIRTWKKKRADASTTGGNQKADHGTADIDLDVVMDEGGEDWDVLPTERGPNIRIPWRPKVPGPNSQHRHTTSYDGGSSKQSMRVDKQTREMKNLLSKGGKRQSTSHTDGYEMTSTAGDPSVGTDEVPTQDGSSNHIPDDESWQDISPGSPSFGADEPRKVVGPGDDVGNRSQSPDSGNSGGRSSKQHLENNGVYSLPSTSTTNDKDSGQSRPTDTSTGVSLESAGNSGDLSFQGGKNSESVGRFNPKSPDQTVTTVAEKARKKSKTMKKTSVHGNDRVKEETTTVTLMETKTQTPTSTKIVTGSSFNRGSDSYVEESSSSDSDAGGYVDNVDLMRLEEGSTKVAGSTAMHVEDTAGSTPPIKPTLSSKKTEASGAPKSLSTGIPLVAVLSGDDLQSLPDRGENGDLSNNLSKETRWQKEESGGISSAGSNQTRRAPIAEEDRHPEPATSGNEVPKTVDGAGSSPTANVEPMVSHAAKSTPNPIPTATLDPSLSLSKVTPEPSVQTTSSVDQSTTGTFDVGKRSKSRGPRRRESHDSLVSVTEGEKTYGMKGLKNGITSLKKGITGSISSLGKPKQAPEHDRPQRDSETETPPHSIPRDDPRVDTQTSSKLSKRRSFLKLGFRDRTKQEGDSKVSKLLEGSTEAEEMPNSSPGSSLDSSWSKLSSSEASLSRGDGCTKTPHPPTNVHADSQSSDDGYLSASPMLGTTSGVTAVANVPERGCSGHDSAKQAPFVDGPVTNKVSTRHVEVSEHESSDEESRTHTTTETTTETETTTVSSGKMLPLGERPKRAENSRTRVKTPTPDVPFGSDKSQPLAQEKMSSHHRQKVHSSSGAGEGGVGSPVDKSGMEQISEAGSTAHVSIQHSIHRISKDTHTNDSTSRSQIAPVPLADIPISSSVLNEGKSAASAQNEWEEATHVPSHTIGVGSHMPGDSEHQPAVNEPITPSTKSKDETSTASHESSHSDTHTRSSSSRSSTQKHEISRSSVSATLQAGELESSSKTRLVEVGRGDHSGSSEFDQRITINVDDSRKAGAFSEGNKAEHVTSTESASGETTATSHESASVTEIGDITSVQISDKISTRGRNTTFQNSDSFERQASYLTATASSSSRVFASRGATREIIDLKPLRDALRQAANLIDEQIPHEDVPWGTQVLEVFGTQVMPILRDFQTNALTWDGYHS